MAAQSLFQKLEILADAAKYDDRSRDNSKKYYEPARVGEQIEFVGGEAVAQRIVDLARNRRSPYNDSDGMTGGDRREVSLLLKECVLHPPNVGSTSNKLLNDRAGAKVAQATDMRRRRRRMRRSPLREILRTFYQSFGQCGSDAYGTNKNSVYPAGIRTTLLVGWPPVPS